MLNTRPTISIMCHVRGCGKSLRWVWPGEAMPPLSWYAQKKADTLAQGWSKVGPHLWLCSDHSIPTQATPVTP